MKDLYTFDASPEQAAVTYDEICASYARILQRLGLGDHVKAEADTGAIGGSKSHEFHVLHDGALSSNVLGPGGGVPHWVC